MAAFSSRNDCDNFDLRLSGKKTCKDVETVKLTNRPLKFVQPIDKLRQNYVENTKYKKKSFGVDFEQRQLNTKPTTTAYTSTQRVLWNFGLHHLQDHIISYFD